MAKKKPKKLVIFATVASWTPKNKNFSSLEIILKAQQWTLHMKYLKLSSQLGYCLKMFRAPDKILVVLDY